MKGEYEGDNEYDWSTPYICIKIEEGKTLNLFKRGMREMKVMEEVNLNEAKHMNICKNQN
jgi:hypothetical protein